MIEDTKTIFKRVKAKNMVSDKQCTKCKCYIAEYWDKHNKKYRPACAFAGTCGFVSHNPARLCRWYEIKGADNQCQ